jgi:hypothetical protein
MTIRELLKKDMVPGFYVHEAGYQTLCVHDVLPFVRTRLENRGWVRGENSLHRDVGGQRAKVVLVKSRFRYTLIRPA